MKHSMTTKLKFIIFNFFGITIFFVPIMYNGKNSILIDHIATFITKSFGDYVHYVVLGLILFGVINPIFTGSWKANLNNKVMYFFKVLGFVLAVIFVTKIGPAVIHEPGNLPFLFKKLAVSLTIIIPIGGMLLCLLTGYGLMDFAGVLVRPTMRKLFKSPGRAAIDAITSFVGSYSLGLIVTNEQYLSGRYTKKEAAIIATGFSTVSVTFMIVVASSLGIMEYWSAFFIMSMVITFIVTAISVRLYPIKNMENVYVDGSVSEREEKKAISLKVAVDEGLKSAKNSVNIFKNLAVSLFVGTKIGASIVSTILSIGLIGLLVGKYTPVFDWIGYVFYPIYELFALVNFFEYPDVALMSKASAISIVEMFLPVTLVKDADLYTKFSIGILSVSEILFFSASIPAILSTKIDIKIIDIMLIWFVRVVLSIILIIPSVKIFLYFAEKS